MTRKTRYFMTGSAAVLAAGLCTGLVAYYGGGFQALVASTGPTELSYVPADAAVVAYADVKSIMDSELRQRFKQSVPGPMSEEGQKEFLEHTGIDIEQRCRLRRCRDGAPHGPDSTDGRGRGAGPVRHREARRPGAGSTAPRSGL